jgi:hypothetical protein
MLKNYMKKTRKFEITKMYLEFMYYARKYRKLERKISIYIYIFVCFLY